MVKRFLIACAVLLFASYAQAQITEPFGTFVGGLPNATSVSNPDALYVLQGGVSKRVSPVAVGVAGTSFGSILWNNAGSLAGFGNYNGTGTIKLGIDVGAPVTQTIAGQSAIAGGTANVAGANLVLQGGQSVGSAAGGAVQIFTSPAGGSGTTQNAAVEVMRVDSAGQVFIADFGVNLTPFVNFSPLQIGTYAANAPNLSLGRYSNISDGAGIWFMKSRASGPPGGGVVQNGDNVGQLLFWADNGANLQSIAAGIQVNVDGSPSGSVVPGRITFATAGGQFSTEAMRIDNSQRVIIGGVGSQVLGGNNIEFQIHGTTFSGSTSGNVRWQNNTASPSIYMAKSRGASIGTHAAVVANDDLGFITFLGDDGTNFPEAAYISSDVDGSVAAGSIPTRVAIWTTPVGGTAPVEGMRIDSKRHVNYTTSAPTASACAGFALSTGSSDTAGRVTFTSATSCAISFANAFTNAPFCSVIPGSAASTVTISTSTTVLTATFGTAQTAMFYQCFGN
jgi:hypothetical protein